MRGESSGVGTMGPSNGRRWIVEESQVTRDVWYAKPLTGSKVECVWSDYYENIQNNLTIVHTY